MRPRDPAQLAHEAPLAREEEPLESLTVLYDGACSVCVRSAEFLEHSSQLVPLQLVDAHSSAARARYGFIPWLGHELVCIDPQQRVWAGPAAFLVTFFCLTRYRWLARLLATELLAPVSELVFRFISDHRGAFGWVVGAQACDDARCGVVISPYR